MLHLHLPQRKNSGSCKYRSFGVHDGSGEKNLKCSVEDLILVLLVFVSLKFEYGARGCAVGGFDSRWCHWNFPLT
jgi:hypothetical protein